jgi:hypothetical protein
MNQIDLKYLLAEERFSPFVITTSDGFSVAIRKRENVLVGARMLITMDSEGNAIHIPYQSIAHIQKP